MPEQDAKPRRRILIIDDEPLIGTVVRRMLAADYDVTPLTSAVEALQVLRDKGPFDLVLCDLMMPEMTGMQLYDEISKADTPLADSMVFLTGGAFTSDARNFLDRVKNERIEKPFDSARLRSIVYARVPPL